MYYVYEQEWKDMTRRLCINTYFTNTFIRLIVKHVGLLEQAYSVVAYI